jgi:hypothetical protein
MINRTKHVWGWSGEAMMLISTWMAGGREGEYSYNDDNNNGDNNYGREVGYDEDEEYDETILE